MFTMADRAQPVDCIYVAAARRDARYTRICVASLRRFYPEIPIRLLAGGRLERGLAAELGRYWAVEPADVLPGDYGWGFVKLEPLFGPSGERFLVLDSDTLITGPVLEMVQGERAPFIVDRETQTPGNARRLYYDWDRLRAIDASAMPPMFVFNSGQWIGTAGLLTRNDFSKWLDWTMPRRLRYPGIFMPGDQGIINLVLNEQVRANRIGVACVPLLRWPGHGLEGFTAEAVAAGTCVPRVVHWAGMKRARQRDMTGADLLAYFEEQYYRRLPGGPGRRIAVAVRDAGASWMYGATTAGRLAWRRLSSFRRSVATGERA